MLGTFTNQNHLFEKNLAFCFRFCHCDSLYSKRHIDGYQYILLSAQMNQFFFPNYINLTAQECKKGKLLYGGKGVT